MLNAAFVVLLAGLGQVDRDALEAERQEVASAYDDLISRHIENGAGLTPEVKRQAKRLLARRRELDEKLRALRDDDHVSRTSPSANPGASPSFGSIVEKSFRGPTKSQFETLSQHRSRLEPIPAGTLYFDLPMVNHSEIKELGRVETQVEFLYDAETQRYRANVKFKEERPRSGFSLFDRNGNVSSIRAGSPEPTPARIEALPDHYLIFENAVTRTPYTASNSFGVTTRAYSYRGSTYAGYPENLDQFARNNGIEMHAGYGFVGYSISFRLPRETAKVVHSHLRVRLGVRLSPDREYTQSVSIRSAKMNSPHKAVIRRFSVAINIVSLAVYDSSSGRIYRTFKEI